MLLRNHYSYFSSYKSLLTHTQSSRIIWSNFLLRIKNNIKFLFRWKILLWPIYMTPHLCSAMRWHIHTPNNHLLPERQLERWAEIFSAFPRQDVPRSSHLAVVPYNSLHWPLPYRWRCDPVSNSGSDSEPEWHIDVSVTQKINFLIILSFYY